MDAFTTICLGLGLGIAAGSLGAASGRAATVRSVACILSVIVGVVAAVLIAGVRDEAAAIAGAAGLVGSLLAVAALGEFVVATSRRAGSPGGIAAWIAGIAAVVVAATLLLAPLALIPFLALTYLWLSRRRRRARKYKGLRSLT